MTYTSSRSVWIGLVGLPLIFATSCKKNWTQNPAGPNQESRTEQPAAQDVDSQAARAERGGDQGPRAETTRGTAGESGVSQDQRHDATVDTSQQASAEGRMVATAELRPSSGSHVRGEAALHKQGGELAVSVRVTGAKPGLHGVHIHETGDCSAPDASSAGAHFNPNGGVHGRPGESGVHAGDLGNLRVGANGEGETTVVLTGAPYDDWQSFVGKAVIVHEREDDLVSQPAGDSGARVACGVLARAE